MYFLKVPEVINALNRSDRIIKRLFDIFLSVLLLIPLFIPICFLVLLASLDLREFGLFVQARIGLFGNAFNLFKIKTIDQYHRISTFGAFLRKTKLDELPQLINVLLGQMSFVGPRPDLKEFLDSLNSEDRIILSVKPGITGPASIKYRNEEYILNNLDNPELYNREVIWPDKVEINKAYIRNYSFLKDLVYLWRTLT